jgi:hypothetical protein
MSTYTIWKTILVMGRIQEIEIPMDAEFLTASEQHGEISIWFKCDPKQSLVKRQLAIIPTGSDVSDDAEYIGTTFFNEKTLVFHVFETFGEMP